MKTPTRKIQIKRGRKVRKYAYHIKGQGRKLRTDTISFGLHAPTEKDGEAWFFFLWGGTKSLGTAATSGLFYKPQMIDEGDCGAIGGMKIGRGNRNTRRKPAPVILCPPQSPT
jgi:hypothetical protein